MSFIHKVGAILERVYDYRSSCGRKEFAAVWGVSLLFAITVTIPLIGFLYWLGHYGSNFDFADELTDAVFSLPNMLAGFFWAVYTLVVGTAVTVAMVFTSIRRLNELGRSRWLTLFYLIPLLGFFLLIWLMFYPAHADELEQTAVVAK